MIATMSKIEIAGPKDRLEAVLGILRERGLFEIDPHTIGFIEKKDALHIDTFIMDNSSLAEKLFLEDLRDRINELLSVLPRPAVLEYRIQPQLIIDSVDQNLRSHLPACKKLQKEKEALQKELAEYSRYSLFLDALEPLMKDVPQGPDVEFIGLVLQDPGAELMLRKALSLLTNDRYELITSTAADGTLAGLIIAGKGLAEKIRHTLSDQHIPELTFPASFRDLPFAERISLLKKRISEISDQIDYVTIQLESFSRKWGALYTSVKDWAEERLALFKATASAFVSHMCFFIYGWMATSDVASLREELNAAFNGEVVIEELEIREEDLDTMPVILKNPAYFKPFELLTRILPLPRYTSYDPTPFIGIFFPVFFGIILGDAGYGILIIIVSLVIMMKYKRNATAQDASKILVVAAAFAVVFGVLYGEFFGDLGHTLFGLEPILIERRTAIVPLLFFSISVGTVHILLGSILGFLSALKKKTRREALARSLHILFILCIAALVASLFGLFPRLLTRPIVLAIFIVTPFLLFTGGLLAPLEVLRSIGNIVSYARIMAIGLTSVLLAYVANRLAGMTGDIVIGIAVAGLLHLLNIVIGIFSPAIHSLRLHYVEFFSKFIESGGRKFEPFRKERKISR